MKESPLPDSYGHDEKREYFRLTVSLPVDYRLEGDAAPPAPKPIKLNLSGGGIGFVTERRFKLGDMLVLTIKLPAQPAVTARAKIVRLNPIEKNETMFSVGAQFTALSEHDQERILQYLLNVQRERRRERFSV